MMPAFIHRAQVRSIQPQNARLAESDTPDGDSVLSISKSGLIRFTEDMTALVGGTVCTMVSIVSSTLSQLMH